LSEREKRRMVGYVFVFLALVFFVAQLALSGRASNPTVNTLVLLGWVFLIIGAVVLIVTRRSTSAT
jgi:hypothetical protein